MAIIESEFGRILEGKVKRKRNAAGALRATMARLASGCPEVMVKITSYGKGAAHVKAHLAYITRNGRIEMENDRGEIFNGADQVRVFFKDWEQDFIGGKRNKSRRDTLHLVLSMPESTPPDAVKSAVRTFSQQTFGTNHEYVFVLHTDAPHPHCHVTVKMLGHNGRRLNPGRKDLADWREDFAQAMRDQGVDAEATRRKSRGIVQKAENTVIRHIEQGDETHPPRRSRMKALQELAAINEIVAEHQSKAATAPSPWEEKIRIKQHAVRNAWLAAAQALDVVSSKPVYQSKEPFHARPDYANLNVERTRGQQRLAALYQCDLAAARSSQPPQSITGLRDMPCLAVVHDSGTDQVLLHANACHRLGRSRTGGNAMRRQGVGALGTLGSGTPLMRIETAIDRDKALATRMYAFIDSMPSIATKNSETKQELLKQFVKPHDQQRTDQPAIEPYHELKKNMSTSMLIVQKVIWPDR